MNRLRVAIAAVTCISLCAPLSVAQTGCKAQGLAGYFEGFAISQQAGKVDVSLNLHCDSGRYAGELVTPIGTYTVKDGAYKAGRMQLTLVAGPIQPRLKRRSKMVQCAETLSQATTKDRWNCVAPRENC